MSRAKEIVAGFVLMLVASTTAVQFFLTHSRYENTASIPYLVALGVAELFLVGLSWRLMFVLTPQPTGLAPPEAHRADAGVVGNSRRVRQWLTTTTGGFVRMPSKITADVVPVNGCEPVAIS